jgi:putative nucleotidyltransferase with HDIG domain
MKPRVRLEVDHFPPLPRVAWKILELTSDLYAGVAPLNQVISRDQTLTARVLRIANSAFFQRGREIHTVEQASAVLGNQRIRGLVVAASLGGVLHPAPQGRALWEHALGVGLSARELASMLRNRVDPEEAFVAGLLHDIGKGLFDAQHAELFLGVLEIADGDEGLTSVEAERMLLGMDHTEAGARVAECWALPASLEEVIRYHHEPSGSPQNNDLCAAVAVGDAICLRLGIGPIRKPSLEVADLAASEMLGLSPESISAVEAEFTQNLARDKSLFGFR